MREATSYCRICLGYCGVRVTVDDTERVVKVRGDFDNPLTQGYACIKGLESHAFQNHPGRVLHPLKKVGDKHVRIGLAEALDEIAAQMKAIIAEDGPQALSVYRGTGAQAASTMGPMILGFAKAVGAQFFSSMTIDQSAKWVVADRLGIWAAGKDPFETADVWLFAGANPLVSVWSWSTPVQNPVKRIKEAKARGTKIIVIDPRVSDMAKFADLHLQITPGEDAAVAAGLLNIILREGWEDKAFCKDHVHGLEALRAAVAPFTPDMVAQRAGITAQELMTAADLFARQAKRGNVVTGTGTSMAPNPNITEHLYECLGVVCGRYLREGDAVPNPGVLRARRPRRAEVLGPARGFEKRPKSRVRGTVQLMGEASTPTLPEEILTPGPGRIRSLLVSGGNLAVALPDPTTTTKAFKALDLLVALEPMMTETARLAHYVLPPPVMFERPDNTWTLEWVNLSTPYAQYTPAIVPPPKDSELCFESFALWSLCKRLGKQIRFAGKSLDMTTPPSEEDLLAMLVDGAVPLDEIKASPSGRIYAPEPQTVEGPGPSAGRFDVMPDDAAAELKAVLNAKSGTVSGYDFRLISRRMREVSNSTLQDLPEIKTRVPFNPLCAHPDDVARLGLSDGARVQVVSAHGRIPAVIESDNTLKRGVVSMTHGFGRLPDVKADYDQVGVSVSHLISLTEDCEPLQAMPRMSAIPVRIEPEAAR
ncbi:MAG: molybdopterin-dependent oxidoreductase [Rhodospirillaceae bacterium]|nr:molybdopterin-dependent oxidoreductase [Rhodospirillaceae bacterium]